MMRRPLCSVCLIVLMFGVCLRGHAAQGATSVTMRAQLEQSEVYLGESVGLELRIHGVRDPVLPDIQHPNIDISREGGQSFSNSSITVINGQTRRIEEFGYAARYLLRPRTAGMLEIPPITLTHEGHTYRSNTVRLVVRQPEPQDRLLVEVATDKPSYVLGESVTLTLNVLLRKLMTNGKILDVDPFFREQPPHLEIPWFASLGDWKTADVETFARPFLGQPQPGFTINSYVDKASLFGRSLLQFTLPRQSTTRPTTTGTSEYFTYQLRKQFRPIRPGVQSIPPVVVKATLPTQVDDRGRALRTEKIIASSVPLTVEVRPVPSTGQPARFIGAVGRFQLTVEATPTTLKVGDPLTLTVVLRAEGDSLLETVHAPVLHEQQTLTQDFKVPADPPAVQVTADTKTFIYTLRPRVVQVRAVPPIEVAYFDPTTGRYQSLHSQPIPLRVEGAAVLSMSDVITAPGSNIQRAPGQELTVGMLANYTGPEVLVPQMARLRVTSSLVVIGIFPPVVYLLTVFGHNWFRQRRQDSGQRRVRQARRQALAALRKLEAQPGASSEDICDGVHRLLMRYISARFLLYNAGLTVDEALAHLRAQHVDPAVIERTTAVLQLCDSARYAPGNLAVVQLNGLIEDVKVVVQGLEARRRR